MRAALMALALLVLVGLVPAQASDKIFRWTGADGKSYFGDTPPAGARDVQPFSRKVGTTVASPEDSGADTAAEESSMSVADCANKRAQLSTYKNATKLVEKDSLGREREYTVEERDLLVKKTQEELETQCGDVASEP